MPIYAYRCASCGHAKDVLQKLADPLLTTCPACGAESFQKQLTTAGFQLKGSGWYVTDFKGGAPAAKPDEAAKPDAAKPAEGAEPAAKTAAEPAPAAKPDASPAAAASPAPAGPPPAA